MVVAAVVAFGLLVRPFGLGAAIVALIVISSFAGRDFSIVRVALLCIGDDRAVLARLHLPARPVHEHVAALMEFLDNLALGFSVALSPTALLYCAIGVTVGMFIGVLPGIGPIATVGMLLPITFHLRPTEALIMLAGIYYGAMYGGSITSILLRLPGDASSAVTVVEGYPMAQQGRAGTALVMTTVASFFGACVAIVCVATLAPPLARAR